MGSVGSDTNGRMLAKLAISDGVNIKYEVVPDEITGTCAVLLTGINRSLCAYLGAANYFTKEFFNRPNNLQFLEKAQYFYISVSFKARFTKGSRNLITYTFSI
jgi:adenosine kinase